MIKPKLSLLIIFIILSATSVSLIAATASAQTVDALQAKIDQRNADIKNLEKEIASYQKQLTDLGSQANSLSATIKSLQISQKKLEANIALTQDKIATKSYEIQKLGSEIVTKQEDIGDDQRIIAQSFNQLNQLGDINITDTFLGSNSVSEALNTLEELSQVQKNVFTRISTLNLDKDKLEINKVASEKAKADLVTLNQQLSDQRKVVLSTVAEQNSLLKETKNSESSYKALLAVKKAQEAAFQDEINAFESQLHLLVDASKLPGTGTGILAWPLDSVYLTQYFGNTTFSTSNPQLYSGKGHPGIDLRAARGTPIKAALSGTVIAVTNMDLIPGCYSYGKWIMIKHPDGLSTLYGHMSLQVVYVGQKVATGEVIGYSGNTGASTGPHLHFGVYASDGVAIRTMTRAQTSRCAGATFPFADQKAYLNPLSYLPTL